MAEYWSRLVCATPNTHTHTHTHTHILNSVFKLSAVHFCTRDTISIHGQLYRYSYHETSVTIHRCIDVSNKALIHTTSGDILTRWSQSTQKYRTWQMAQPAIHKHSGRTQNNNTRHLLFRNWWTDVGNKGFDHFHSNTPIPVFHKTLPKTLLH